MLGAGVLLLAGGAGLGAMVAGGRVSSSDPAPVVRFGLGGPVGFRIQGGFTQPFAVSDDGRTVVFSADDGSGNRLWARPLDDPRPRALAGSERGIQPSISPDGEWVAFVVANHIIRKVRLSGSGGGDATTIATLDGITAALDWLSDDELVFEALGAGLQRISANGGAPRNVLPVDTAGGEIGQRRPLVLREQGVVLFTSLLAEGPARLDAVSLADGRRGRLDLEGTQALGLIAGHLVYTREDGAVMAVGFDVGGLRTQGAPQQLPERTASTGFGTPAALSPTGTLVYQLPQQQLSRLVLANGSNRVLPLGDSARVFREPRFSPDGRRIAVGIGDGDIWVVDRVSGAERRATRGGEATLVDWMPDNRDLVFLRGDSLWVQSVDVGARRHLGAFSMRVYEASLDPAGRWVVVLGGRSQVLRVALDSGAVVDTIIPPRSPTSQLRAGSPRVSPDGLWISFTDRNELQVYVRSLSDGTTLQISDVSGSEPVWGADASRLYYHSGQSGGNLVLAELQTAPTLDVLRRQRVAPAAGESGTVKDVAADGTLLMLVPVGQGPDVRVVVGWDAEIRRILGARGGQ
jgi:Tol biopolymer transport system component